MHLTEGDLHIDLALCTKPRPMGRGFVGMQTPITTQFTAIPRLAAWLESDSAITLRLSPHALHRLLNAPAKSFFRKGSP